jgi:class 3 adenylate cyclase
MSDGGQTEISHHGAVDLIDPAIAEHGGRIVNTGGDSLLMVFDSVDGAVRCAMKVQSEARRALAISPNIADCHCVVGLTLLYSGEPGEALDALRVGMRRDP